MVSTRLKKRFILLLVFACAGMLCFYKVYNKTRRVSPEIKTAPMSASFVSYEGEKVTTEQQNELDIELSQQDDEIEENEVSEFYQNDTTDREPAQETGSDDTEPHEKIHGGLEENEEIQETMAWLDEIGASVPPSKPALPVREMTTPWKERSRDAATARSEFRDQPLTLYHGGRNELITQWKPSVARPSNSSGGLGDEVTESELIHVSNTSWKNPSNASSTSVKLRGVHAKQFGVVLLNQSSNITNSNEDPPSKRPTVSQSSSKRSSLAPPTSQQHLSEEPLTTARTKTPPFTRSHSFHSPASMYSPSPSLTGCKLPNLDPWDPSVRHLLKDVGEDPGCREKYPLPAFDVVANRLVPNGEINTNVINFHEVNLETIHRDEDDDWNVHFVDRGNPFNNSAQDFHVSRVIYESDFFKVTYKLETGREDGHYFARVVPRNDVIVKSNEIRQNLKQQLKNEGLGLNVLMLGFDSVSSASFRRKMPKTLRYLKESLKTYIVTGQTVIGDGTSPALTAMLAGLHETEAPEGRQGFDNSATIDKWPWIMKLFKEHGYVTMMAEDDPMVGAFNLRLQGFKEPPADHYARPFWLSLEEREERDEPGLCSRSTFMVNYTLDYILSYFESYPDTPKFAFTFMSYLSHAHPNHLSYADNDVLRLLRLLVKRGYHNNTLIVIFGDHGSRNDDVRNTMQGKLEERLPWLSISLPAWLRKRYPDITSALEHNQYVISSPFDLHATLHHVLTYPNDPQGEKTQTLFKKLNKMRTCGDAEIREHWCPCLAFKDVNISHPHVVGGAQVAIKYINDVILNRTELLRKSCAIIHLKKILKASQYRPNERLRRFRDTNQHSDRAVNFGAPTDDHPHYRINFMTSPGDALFEVSVTVHDGNKVTVSPHISRTNLYGTQPSCILRKIPYARKFCYCK